MTEQTIRTDAEPREAVHRFSRWPGLLLLSLGVLLPFLSVLAAQGILYMSLPWACAGQHRLPLHVIPVASLGVIAWCGVTALGGWRRAGGSGETEHDSVLGRSRFLALLGVAAAVFAALIQLVMWLPIFIIDPCMRS